MDKAIEMLDQSTGLGERVFHLEHTGSAAARLLDVAHFLEMISNKSSKSQVCAQPATADKKKFQDWSA